MTCLYAADTNGEGFYNESYCSDSVPAACPAPPTDVTSASDSSTGLNGSEKAAVVFISFVVAMVTLFSVLHYLRLDKSCMVYVDDYPKTVISASTYEVL